MAVKGMSEQDLGEYLSLVETVGKVQNLLMFAGHDEDLTVMLRRFLENAKSHIGRLEITAAENERKYEDEQARAAVQGRVIAALVERESALSDAEKKEYRTLLEHSHFTKSMFGAIEHFYAHSYDKLTEGGRAEVSHRVWEGVRQGEYRFQELPEIVKQKEAASLNDQLKRKTVEPELLAIPIEERRAFLDAWVNKDCRKAYAILDRPTFAAHVSKSSEPAIKSESKAVTNSEVGSKVVAMETRESETSNTKTTGNAVGETEFKLDDLKLLNAEPTGQVTPPLAGSSGGGAKVR